MATLYSQCAFLRLPLYFLTLDIEDTLISLWLLFWKLKGQMCASFHVSGDRRRDRRAETEGKKLFSQMSGYFLSMAWSLLLRFGGEF